MKFFIDTADTKEIRDAYAMGLIDGVTTNPTLISRTGREFEPVVKEILEIVDGPVSIETISMDAEGMVKEAERFSSWNPEKAVIKLPLTLEGLKATKTLSSRRIKTNVTLCFSPSQALLAAKAGATYVSPFVGRLDDISQDGMELIEQIVTIYNNYDYETQVLAASVRNPLHIVQAAMMGADVATIPYKVLTQLVKHPLTDKGIESFMADWAKVPKKG